MILKSKGELIVNFFEVINVLLYFKAFLFSESFYIKHSIFYSLKRIYIFILLKAKVFKQSCSFFKILLKLFEISYVFSMNLNTIEESATLNLNKLTHFRL